MVASSKDKTFSYIPELDPATFTKDADYFHICMNNTIYGTKCTTLPETGERAPGGGYFLLHPCPSRSTLAGSACCMPALRRTWPRPGLTVVIIREDLIGHARDITPTMFNYQTHADNGSMYNTPPCYAIYICKLVLEWIKNDIGGAGEDEGAQREEGRAPVRFPGSAPSCSRAPWCRRTAP